MFKKILIANRGEIAARIIRTCKRLGIRTVAIYSEADAQLPYVSMADESYLLGPPQVKESYLNIPKILDIAKQTNTDAIHPGYGFMSENEAFVQQCEKEGIVFIGPEGSVMKQMGNKVEARRLMKEAGVPIIPGSDHLTSLDKAIEIAQEIGYPVMLKAAAGGGGIGMQIVHNDQELENAFESIKKRATSYFGNDSVYVEKLLEQTRHIEFQILADKHGNAIHLFDRECSIQRRNQKVMEEAPSPFLSDQTREKMGKIAVKAVQKLAYTNAGTIEFLVDKEENFFFLEMNTRIQVEHAITEKITEIDIVEKQLEIAAGEKLSLSQEDVILNGHAIEARIYAEDPITFFPSPGKITEYTEPKGEGIRIDSTVTKDTNVTPFYDPMISKLVVHSSNRNEAVSKMQEALSAYKIEGIKTNIPLLSQITQHDQFQKSNTLTNFISTYMNK